MIRFNSDYTEGCHPAILQKLAETNMVQTAGYGEDEYCAQARELIRKVCGDERVDVHFLVGGTQTNVTVISAALKHYQGVITAKTGHINIHETGALEACGHKCLCIETPDGKLTAKNADISGSVNANSGTLNNVTINENCRVLGKLSANQIEGDLVKTVGKAFPRDSRAPERWPSGTITVRVYDDQPFDRQIVIPAVAFSGAKHEREHTDIYSSCRLIVRKNGAEIYNRTALDNTLIYSGVIDMPAGHGHMTLEFSVSAWLVNGWYPTASISDLLVVVMKKATAGITIS